MSVSVTAVISKTRKTPYIIIKDFGPRVCHSENAKICINWPKVLEITQKMVVICNSLVYEQIFSQNLAIFNIWEKNGIFCPNYGKKWLKIRKSGCFYVLWILEMYTSWGNCWWWEAKILYVASQYTYLKKWCTIFFNFHLLAIFGGVNMVHGVNWAKLRGFRPIMA